MPLTPFFRTPFTDFSGGLINAQHYSKCGEFELNMLECMEAYGQDRGKIKCRDLIDDYYECFARRKVFARQQAMRNERLRQYRAGEIKERFEPPPKIDAF